MPVIAIDGPAAAGKGTLARAVSNHFSLPYLDTGLLYRATARRVLDSGEDPVAAARDFRDSDLSREGLRAADVSQEASRVSAIPEVRAALTQFQKDFAARPGGAVLDGRDIGTVICPDADLKLFITAEQNARARRRHAEIHAAGGADSFAHVLDEMKIRDARDSGRADAPLKPASDACIIDTTHVSLEEVRARVFAMIAPLIKT